MEKVSFHASGFPWMTKEEQEPLKYTDFNRGTAIMNRTLRIPLSYYYSKQMVIWIATMVNSGLDTLHPSSPR
jgi:hypothetical protein